MCEILFITLPRLSEGLMSQHFYIAVELWEKVKNKVHFLHLNWMKSCPLFQQRFGPEMSIVHFIRCLVIQNIRVLFQHYVCLFSCIFEMKTV